jgi:hypothetical protein
LFDAFKLRFGLDKREGVGREGRLQRPTRCCFLSVLLACLASFAFENLSHVWRSLELAFDVETGDGALDQIRGNILGEGAVAKNIDIPSFALREKLLQIIPGKTYRANSEEKSLLKGLRR